MGKIEGDVLYRKYEYKIAKVWEEAWELPELPQDETDRKKEEYQRKEDEIIESFKKALFKKYKIENNDKREIIWKLAMEKRENGGLEGVEKEFIRLLNLIK